MDKNLWGSLNPLGLNSVKRGNNTKLERKIGNTSPFIYLNRYALFEKCFCFYLHYKILIKRFNSLLLTLSILSLTPVSLQNAFQARSKTFENRFKIFGI